jgi:uncharacterized membrane protein
MALPANALPPDEPRRERWSDREVDQVIGRLLQIGVLLSTIVVLIGGARLLMTMGSSPVSFSTFHGESPELRSVGAALRAALAGDPRATIQLGLVLLIATPVARVALTLIAFAIQRDRLYVLLTTVVLALLLYGLFW